MAIYRGGDENRGNCSGGGGRPLCFQYGGRGSDHQACAAYSRCGSRAPAIGNAVKWRDFLGLESTHKG